MLQIFTMMFFSLAALAASALLAEMFIEGWLDVKRALGLDARTAPLPRPAAARLRLVRTTARAAAQPALRAAA